MCELPTFKDFVDYDTENVFFDTTEFAEPLLIDNKQINVVVDDDSLEKYNASLDNDSLIRGDMLFFAPVSSFDKELFVDKEIKIKRTRYTIIDLSVTLGVYRVVMVGVQS